MRSRIARFTSLAASRSKLGGTWEKHAHVSSLNHTKSSSLVQSSRCIDACEPAHQHPKQDAGKRWPGGSAFLLALGATGAYALGETRDSRETSPVGRSAALEGLNHFLAKCSVDVRGIEVRQIAKVPNDESNTDDNDELGLVVTREGARMYGAGLLNWVGSWLTPWTWFGETQLARFPLTAVISLDTATEDPWFGGMITELVAAGVMNERSALALYLALHRSLGAASPLFEYLAALPLRTNAPILWADSEIKELRGTQLHAAVLAMHKSMARQWSKVAPLAKEAAAEARASLKGQGHEAYVAGRDPDQADFLWAHAMLMSRAISLPTGPHGMSELSLVPGLDFANHSPKSPFRWEVQVGKSGGWEDSAVALVGPRARCRRLREGEEVRIDYGERSEEESLFQYGMLTLGPSERWRYDKLRLAFPVAADPSERDEDTDKRVTLVAALGLPVSMELGACPADSERIRKMSGKEALEVLEGAASSGAFDALRIFTMPGVELDGMLSAKEACDERGTEFKGADWGALRDWEATEQMAVLTTLVRLLELRWADLEGEEGTGALEEDVVLMERANLSGRLLTAVTYRAQQKRAVREWVVVGRRALAYVMAEARVQNK